jgi:hypothetical protein
LTGQLSAGRLTKAGRLAIVIHIKKKNRTGRASPMTEQNITADTDELDDTEGHRRTPRADDAHETDDTEGHFRRNADEDADDTEGHMRRDADEEDDDVEGHAGGSRRP